MGRGDGRRRRPRGAPDRIRRDTSPRHAYSLSTPLQLNIVVHPRVAVSVVRRIHPRRSDSGVEDRWWEVENAAGPGSERLEVWE